MHSFTTAPGEAALDVRGGHGRAARASAAARTSPSSRSYARGANGGALLALRGS